MLQRHLQGHVTGHPSPVFVVRSGLFPRSGIYISDADLFAQATHNVVAARGAPSREPAARLRHPAAEAALRARRLPHVPPPHRVRVAPYEAEGAVEVPHAVVRGARPCVHLHVPPPEEGACQAAAPAKGGGGTACQSTTTAMAHRALGRDEARLNARQAGAHFP